MNHTSTGEAVQFWILGTVAVIGALGVVTARRAVYSALFLAMTMVILAIFYIAQGAVFLGVAQVVVYTGAVMMLFLFVLMLVGVDSSDSLVETLRGQRVAAVVVGLGFGLLLIGGIGRFAVAPRPRAGFTPQVGNVEGLADLIFVRYVWAFELTGALLITATIGAMVLAHRERFVPRPGQAEMSRERLRKWARGEGKFTPMPSPGVYAQHNAVDIPALLPDGTFADSSVAESLPRREVSTTPPGERPELERGGR